MSKIVGVTIDTKSNKTKEKVYYYRTNEDLKLGDVVKVKMESGGTPSCTVVVEDSQKKFSRKIKDLDTK